MASIQQLWQGSRTLCCLLQGLEGQRVTVEMKTMRWLRGDIHMVNVDLRYRTVKNFYTNNTTSSGGSQDSFFHCDHGIFPPSPPACR
jgi:hypothetical protein